MIVLYKTNGCKKYSIAGISTSKLALMLGAILCSLFLGYYFLVNAYMFEFVTVSQEPNWGRGIVAMASLLMVVIIAPCRQTWVPGVFFYHIFFYLLLIPTVIIYILEDRNFMVFGITIALFLSWGLVSRMRIIPLVQGVLDFKVIAYASLTAVILIIMLLLSERSLNFSFETIYKVRQMHDENTSLVIEYAFPAAIRCFVPILAVFSLARKNRSMLIITFMLSTLLFGLTLHRTALLVVPAVAGIWWLANRREPAITISLAFTALSAIVAVSSNINLNPLVSDLLGRRLWFVPSYLNYEYFSFFQDMPKIIWSNSKVGLGLFEFPYNKQPPFLIGDAVNMPGSHSNAGLIGSGYMHLSSAGIAIYALIYFMIIKLLNSLSSNRIETSVVISVSFMGVAWILISSDLPSVFLTHGFGWALLILLLLKKGLSQGGCTTKRLFSCIIETNSNNR